MNKPEIGHPQSEIKYHHLFFDLDHTIWDFDKNAEETLQELFVEYDLPKLGLHSAELFIQTYTRNNHQLWADYHVGKITKATLREMRFKKTFLEMGVSPEVIPVQFEDDYVRICPTKTNLFEGAHETLQYLHGKYTLHLITNGFKESQDAKINGTGIGKYFDQIIVSEDVGVNKPDPAIFQHALNMAGAEKSTSIMIGDSLEADVMGALNFGMDAIYFNPAGLPKPEYIPLQISNLNELTLLL